MNYRLITHGVGGQIANINSRRRSRSESVLASARQHHGLFDDNSQQRKMIIHSREQYFDSNMIHEGKSTSVQCFPKNLFAVDVDRSKCLHSISSNANFCTRYVNDVNYFSLITVTLP